MGKSNFLIPYNKIEKTERFAIAQMNEEKKQDWGHASNELRLFTK
jgi:hypothetical protein